MSDSERHAMKMAKKKAARDKIIATKTDEKGLIVIHTGKGKGQKLCRVRHDFPPHRP